MEDAILFPPPAGSEVLFCEVAEAVPASTVVDSEVRADCQVQTSTPEVRSDVELEPMKEWPSSKAEMEALETLQFYDLTRGDEPVIGGVIDVSWYESIVRAQRVQETQTKIEKSFSELNANTFSLQMLAVPRSKTHTLHSTIQA